MRKQWFLLIMALLISITLWGCGSDRSGETAITDPDIEDAARTGNCTICHVDFVHSQLDGIAGINPDPSADPAVTITHDCEDCHGGGEFHHGLGPIPFPDPDGSRCITCHESQTNAIVSTKHNAEENFEEVLNEDLVNLEMLATSHQEEYCQRCHTAEGSREFADVIGNSDEYEARIVVGGEFEPLEFEDADGNPLLHNPVCGACHNPLTKEMVEIPGWDPNDNSVADQFDLCTSCHILNLDSEDGFVLLGSGLPLEDGAGEVTEEFYHNTAWYRTLLSTHRDNPDTGSVGDNDPVASGIQDVASNIEGYVVRKDSANPCFDCHGHNLLTNTGNLSRDRSLPSPSGYRVDPDHESTIYTQWASSAHAGGLLKAKYAAQLTGNTHPADSTAVLRDARMTQLVSDAAVQDLPVGNAWAHYNWDRSGRSSCQMCHTATGASNFNSDPDNYNAANNDYSHLDGWAAAPADGSPQNEILYCWGCHSNAAEGELMTPGAITLAYGNKPVLVPGADLTLPAVPIVMPDYGNSNVCINCHSGRGNMTTFLTVNHDNNTSTPNITVAADPAALTLDGANIVTGGTDTHYYGSGATINQALTNVGYLYVGQNYDNPSYYAHNSLGCAECHMSSEESHLFDVVEKNTSDAIIALTGQNCIDCHDGEHGVPFVAVSQVGTTQNIWNGTSAVPTTVTQQMADDAAAELEHEAHAYHNAIEAFGVVLTAAGTTPQSNYPYFSGLATDQGHGGAMHNWSYVHHEPGGFAHNRFYVKRLIFDSIDWLTDPATGAVQAAGARALDGVIFDDPAYADGMAWLDGDPATAGIQRP